MRKITKQTVRKQKFYFFIGYFFFSLDRSLDFSTKKNIDRSLDLCRDLDKIISIVCRV